MALWLFQDEEKTAFMFKYLVKFRENFLFVEEGELAMSEQLIPLQFGFNLFEDDVLSSDSVESRVESALWTGVYFKEVFIFVQHAFSINIIQSQNNHLSFLL